MPLCRLIRWTFQRSLILFCAVGLTATNALADDWPQWGGPQRDCVWRETGIVESLPEGKLPRVWSKPLGEGYCGPAVAAGREPHAQAGVPEEQCAAPVDAVGGSGVVAFDAAVFAGLRAGW